MKRALFTPSGIAHSHYNIRVPSTNATFLLLHLALSLALELLCLALGLSSDLASLSLGLAGHLACLALGLASGVGSGLLDGVGDLFCERNTR